MRLGHKPRPPILRHATAGSRSAGQCTERDLTPATRSDPSDVIFIGQPGTGKSHLSVGLGMKACQADYSVRFTTIHDLAATLRASMADHTTEACIQQFVEPDLVILDELGFTPLDPLLADAFYRIVASRYEQSSTIITSNKSFESWAEVFPDSVIASAILDRLVHHAHLVPIIGDSYRMKNITARQKGGGSTA